MKLWEKEASTHLTMKPTHQVGSGNAIKATSFSHRSRLMSGFQLYTTPRVALGSWLYSLKHSYNARFRSAWSEHDRRANGCDARLQLWHKAGTGNRAKAPRNQQRGKLLKGPTLGKQGWRQRAGGQALRLINLKLKAYRQAIRPTER